MGDKYALKYINQLAEAELKDLLLSFAKSCYGVVDIDDCFRCKHNTNLIYLEAMCNVSPFKEMQYFCPIELALDDYNVYSIHNGNFEIAYHFEDEYHKYMRSKFGQQYTIDWAKNRIDRIKSN